MSINTAETTQSFPFGYEKVFDGLIAVLGPAGFQVTSSDRVIGRILATAGMSSFSWGENITLRVERESDSSTRVVVQSNLKVGFNLTGSGKNAQNAERIIGALSHFLQSDGTNPKASASAAPSANAPAVLAVLLLIVFLIILLPYLLG